MGTRRRSRPGAAARPARRGSFTVLLAGVLATLGLVGLGRFAGPLVIAVQAATLLYAMWTAGSRSRVTTAAGIALACLTVALLTADLGARGHPGRLAGSLTSALGAVLAAGTITAILLRIRTHHDVTAVTVSAALSVYLLIGLSYAYVYDFIGEAGRGAFFAGAPRVVPLDYLYFSIITMATVGYGDLTPAASAGRMVAAAEAVTGQLYLVTVVAMVVGNFALSRAHLVVEERPEPPAGAPPTDNGASSGPPVARS